MSMRTGLILLTVVLVAASPAFAQEADDTRADRATDKALEYIARMQRPDGSWPGNTYNKNAAIAGLAVMAFMA